MDEQQLHLLRQFVALEDHPAIYTLVDETKATGSCCARVRLPTAYPSLVLTFFADFIPNSAVQWQIYCYLLLLGNE